MDIQTVVQNALQQDFKIATYPLKHHLDNRETIMQMLKAQQLECFKAFIDFLNSPRQVFMVNGAAGTGKTFLACKLIEDFIRQEPSGIVSVCAPTNKAVSVLTQKANFNNKRVSFSTLHSKLSLSRTVDHFGRELFTLSDFGKSRWGRSDLFVVDEISMVDAAMEGHLHEYAKQFPTCKFLFVGDFAQVPPVNEVESRFNINFEELKARWDILRYELDEPIRQGEGSPIIDLALYIRNNLRARLIQYPYQTVMNDQGSVGVLPRGDKGFVYGVLSRMYTTEQFKNHSDFCKVLAWRNATLKGLNNLIRQFVYPTMYHLKICINENLIFNKPYIEYSPNDTDGTEKGTILFTTNEECCVESFEVRTLPVMFDNDMYHFKIYETTVRRITKAMVRDSSDSYAKPFSDNDIEVINIIHEDDEQKLNNLIIQFEKKINSQGQSSFKKLLWKRLFRFKENFADITYSYAVSVHKSQGSTYQNAIISEMDIMANQKEYERNRILYTAYTRPSTNLLTIR